MRTTCPLDCPDMCALEVVVEGNRVEQVQGVRNNGERNFICSKVTGFGRRLVHPDRLTMPLRRIGPKGKGEFEAISWSDAIGSITAKFRAIQREFGGEAIVPFHYGGSNGLLTDGLIDRLFFARLGASRLDKTICAVPTTEVAVGMYGKMPGVAFEDYVHARCIVVWGANPKGSSIHHVPYLREAKRRGAFVVTVDPRRNFSAKEVDLHLPIRPGTDVVLALSLIHWWRDNDCLDTAFLSRHTNRVDTLLDRSREWTLPKAADVTGLDPADIELLARRLAESQPAVIRCGWGLERNRNGGQAIAAVLAIPALLGKFGVRGGGYTMSNSGAARADVDGLLGGVDWNTRRINMTRLGKLLFELSDPPIKGLFVYNANPVATVPNQNLVIEGLSRPDLFTVVFEQMMTDTAVFADVVLPATTFLEHRDVRVGYGRYGIGGTHPVIEPVGESKPNAVVFAELGRAMGFKDHAFHWEEDELVERIAGRVQLPDATADADVLQRGEIQAFDFDGSTPIQFENVFPRTDDRKVDLCPAVLGPEPYSYSVADDPFPLTLISPAAARLTTSTFGESNLPKLHVTVHPEDAAERGIRHGQVVRVHNALGEVHCTARVSERIRPGVVSIPKGAWRKSAPNGSTSTALCPDHVNVVGGAACFNDARVDVSPLTDVMTGDDRSLSELR